MIPVKATAATREQYVRNIVATFKAANSEQDRRGRTWYTTAHELADMISEGNVVAGAGVIAALSANKSWHLNQKIAAQAFATGEPAGHTTPNLVKAARIMAGESPMDVLPMDAKTGNFYRCILDPTDQEAVCVDRHAHDVAVGEVYGDRERGLSAKGRYALIAHAYREAAQRLDEIPSTVQAVTWIVQVESLAGIGTRTNGHAPQEV